MNSLSIWVFWFVQLTEAVKLVSLQTYDRKYLSLKPQTQAFFQSLPKSKNSYQTQAAIQNLDRAANLKRLSQMISLKHLKNFLYLKYDKTAKLHILTNIFLYGEISSMKNRQKSINDFLIPLMVKLSIQW